MTAPLPAPPYLKYFNLREAPFSLTPDTGFAFSTRCHQEALNTLLVAIRAGEGFIKIVGEVGTGKTLLCRKFLNGLRSSHLAAYIPNPNLTPDELLLALAEELQVSVERSGNAHLLVNSLNRALLSFAAAGRPVVVCLDEAQAIPRESLETLRLLSNLETEKRKLLQIVLFGQPELETRLDDPAIRQLKQRITFSYTLDVMDAGEIGHYLAHRLRTAGSHNADLFTPAAAKLIYKASRGVPRLINILANKSLMAAYGEGASQIKPRQVKLAIVDTDGVNRRIWW